MAWLELHQSVAWHKKTYALAQKLKVRRAEALGLVATLWLWALEHAQDGALGHLTDREVSAAAGWHRNPAQFVLALNEVGFLDNDGSIHDWYDFAGRLIERRQDNADRMRSERTERARKRAQKSHRA